MPALTRDADLPLGLSEVLGDELRALGGPAPAAQASVEALQRAHGEAGHAALCLSGGGVRSASFNLGVLQGLSRAGVLGGFDYLSTVSGGGYVGGWLSAWRTRAVSGGAADPIGSLAPGPGAPAAATAPLRRLREFIRFLDPRLGVGSADVWTLGTIVLRNLLLNWLVLVPLLAAAILAPRLYLGLLGLPSQPELVSASTLAWWSRHDVVALTLLFGCALLYAAVELPSLGNRRHGQRAFLLCFLLPTIAGETILSARHYWSWRYDGAVPLSTAVLLAVLIMPIPWLIGGILSRRWWRPWTWLAVALSAAMGRAAIWAARHVIAATAHDHPQLFATLDLPVTLILIFAQMTLFAGLASRDMTDDDREWWGRAAAWVLMAGIGWLVAGVLVIYAPVLLSKTFSLAGWSDLTGRLWLGLLILGLGAIASRLGASSRLRAAGSRLSGWLFVAAAPGLIVLLAVLLATADLGLLQFIHRLGLLAEVPRHPEGASLPEDLLAIGFLLVVGLAASRLVSVNTFSLHAMYRQRLTRSFLGASRDRGERRPNPFTGFDPGDDLPMHETIGPGKPLHVVNMTLNTLAATDPAVEERRAQSFTVSALHAGAAQLGYRPTRDYAGGLSLGESLTISGAAVSPAMGAASKPAETFLLTVFNARLGAWLANPGRAGNGVWRKKDTQSGATPLLDELLGLTRDESPYVYLSDGGHFENLGLYEMVRRRCRFVVVSDASCDPSYRFDDLANAIRKARLDFGIEVEFPDGLGIAGAGGPCAGRWALGRIRYSAADPEAADGVVLYLKAALCGNEPVDVANYAAAHATFPHQSTSNQWFDDAQFESYRMLGFYTVQCLTDGRPVDSVAELCARGAAGRTRPAASADPIPSIRI